MRNCLCMLHPNTADMCTRWRLASTTGGSTEVPYFPALSVDDLSGVPVAVYVEAWRR